MGLDRIIDHLKLTFAAERPPPPQAAHQELMMAADRSASAAKKETLIPKIILSIEGRPGCFGIAPGLLSLTDSSGLDISFRKFPIKKYQKRKEDDINPSFIDLAEHQNRETKRNKN